MMPGTTRSRQRNIVYLPDEILLEILNYIPKTPESQGLLAKFCLVSRQWYDVAIRRLYESPHLAGRGYELFVRTICPSINVHIRKSELAGLVKVLDLSHIVHNSNKSTTARLLGRTKSSLEVFIAPQASFAINCWASLSKCTRLTRLDLTLVSECISYQALSQTLRQVPRLTHLYLPRCSSNYDALGITMNVQWPPKLQHLALAGNVHGKFLWDMLGETHDFPPSLTSLSISHAPGVDASALQLLICNLGSQLTTLELRDIPGIRQGQLNAVLDWAPRLQALTIATDYIDVEFGNMPPSFDPSLWPYSKPLEYLKLVTSGSFDFDTQEAFAAVDLYTLIDERFLGRLRVVDIVATAGWSKGDESGELGALENLLVEVDWENWEKRRGVYEGMRGLEGWKYEEWSRGTAIGRRMRPRLRILAD